MSEWLTKKQLRALRAVADPTSDVGAAFWHDAHSRAEPTHTRPNGRPLWPGLRRSLGSLEARGLVRYTGERWEITKAGAAALREELKTARKQGGGE